MERDMTVSSPWFPIECVGMAQSCARVGSDSILKKKSFTLGVIEHWNKLLSEIVNVP